MKRLLAPILFACFLLTGCNNLEDAGAGEVTVPLSGPALNTINHSSDEVTVLKLHNRMVQKNVHRGENSYSCISYPHFTVMDCFTNGGKAPKFTNITYRQTDYMPLEIVLKTDDGRELLCLVEETFTTPANDNKGLSAPRGSMDCMAEDFNGESEEVAFSTRE